MSAVEGHHQRGALDDLMADGMLLQNIGAVPGEDDVIFIVKQACRQPVSITAIASKKNVRIFQMKGPQLVGEIASLIAFGIADAKGSYQTGRGLTLLTAVSIRSRMAFASRKNILPAGVSATGRLERLNSWTFIDSSKARICWVMAVWDM